MKYLSREILLGITAFLFVFSLISIDRVTIQGVSFSLASGLTLYLLSKRN